MRREDHARGLVRLLSLGLRVLTLLEHVVREALQTAAESLQGPSPGNPKRETVRPTTEKVLRAFDGITLTVVKLPGQTIRQVTALSAVRQRILTMSGLVTATCMQLANPQDAIPPSLSRNERTLS